MPGDTQADRLRLLASFLRAPGEELLDTLSRVCGSLSYARPALRWRDDGLPDIGARELAGTAGIPAGPVIDARPYRTAITSPAGWACLDLLYTPDPRAASCDFWPCENPTLAGPGQAFSDLERRGLKPFRCLRWGIEALLTPAAPGRMAWLFERHPEQDSAVLACRRELATPLESKTERVYIAHHRLVPALEEYTASTMDRSRIIPARPDPVPPPPVERLDGLVADLCRAEELRCALGDLAGWRGRITGVPISRLEAIRDAYDALWQKYEVLEGPEARLVQDALAGIRMRYRKVVG